MAQRTPITSNNTSHFSLFSDLPQELQDHVWDMAIRDDVPSTQFFTMCYNAKGGMNPTVPLGKTIGATRAASHQSSVGFAAPRAAASRDSGQSWADGNKSAYMTDSGLWTACRGSRARMLKHFKPEETSSLMSKLAPVEVRAARHVCLRHTATATMPFQRDNGERQYLTMKPMEDLLYLSTPAGSTPYFEAKTCWWWLKSFPPFRWQRPGGGWHTPFHCRHIAVEFDRAFDHQLGYISTGASQPGPVSREEGAAALRRFWIVDYGLQRRYRVDRESDRRDRQIFRAGDDHEFVEVLDTDTEWSDGGVLSQGLSAAHRFAAKMTAMWLSLDGTVAHVQQMLIESFWDNNREDEGGSEEYYYSLLAPGAISAEARSRWRENIEPHRPRFGVLAYVKRGSER